MRNEAQALPRVQSSPTGGYWAISIRRLFRNRLAVVCLAVIALLYGSGALAALVTPYGYDDQDLSMAKQGPSVAHPFGTDRLGRDMMTRVIYGLRTTVIITVVSLATGSLAIGITLGLLAGYFGRWLDTVIMRVGEVTTAFPEIFLILIIVQTVKPPIVDWVRGIEDSVGVEILRLGVVDYVVLSFALAMFSWFGMARLVRGQVFAAREAQYVDAAQSVGCSTPRILLRHVLPNVMGPIIVVVSAGLGSVAGAEVLLSFLGIGIQPPTPSLGLMMFEYGSISELRSNPHLLLFPAGTLTVLLFAFNLLGDGVNDAFNPRAR